jgi:hypothetical protein
MSASKAASQRNPGRALLVLIAWLCSLAAQIAIPAQASAGAPHMANASREAALLLDSAFSEPGRGERNDQDGDGDDSDWAKPDTPAPVRQPNVGAHATGQATTVPARATSSYDARGPPFA